MYTNLKFTKSFCSNNYCLVILFLVLSMCWALLLYVLTITESAVTFMGAVRMGGLTWQGLPVMMVLDFWIKNILKSILNVEKFKK